MPGNTTINGLRYAVLSDSPNALTGFKNLADDVDPKLVSVFSTTGARDTAIPTPNAGMLSFVSGTGELYLYNGTGWIGAVPRSFYKTSDQNFSNTTLTSVSGMNCSLEANSVYIAEVVISMVGPSASDLKSDWTVPSGATGTRFVHGMQTASGDRTNILAMSAAFSLTSTVNYGLDLAGNLASGAREQLYIKTTNAGTLQLRGAQNVSSGTVTVQEGTNFMIRKVA